jgi:hypothetical protein
MTDKTYIKGLEGLLNLNGEIFPMDSGYWTKIEAWCVDPSSKIPHGVRYSLTLHDRNNMRVLGYDNAHAVKPVKKRFGAVKTTWDHTHRMKKIEPYEFESAAQLMEDFWIEADRFINEGKR